MEKSGKITTDVEKNKEIFFARVKEKYGDKFDLSKVEFKNGRTKVCIICPIHGEFYITPQCFLKYKEGCPKCGPRNKRTTEEFINEANEVHNNFYDYSKTEFKKYKEKVCIICPEHGEFWQTPGHHLSGEGCPICRYIKSSNSKRRSVEEVKECFAKVHGDEYDYSLITEYKERDEKLPIICRKHGVFYQTFSNHYNNKQGCPKCGLEKCTESQRYTCEDFVNKANKVHDKKYDYSKVNYINSITKVDIICPEHGVFSQKPANHLSGQGCPKCFMEKSKVEREILDYVKSLVGDEKVIENNRKVLNGYELDIYVPNKKFAVEVNGLIWHSEKFGTEANYHKNKTDACAKLGIDLIQIYEDEWYGKQDIVKSMLRNRLGVKCETIYARKCGIREVTPEESSQFLNTNHIEGDCPSKFRYGLYYNNELVSLMTFTTSGKKNEKNYEIVRYCNKININIIGGASKLMKHFISTIAPDKIYAYANRRYTQGNLYEKIGFKLVKATKPNYCYVDNKKRIDKSNRRKSILISKYNCPKDMNEHDFCLSQGWYRLYDSGNLKFEWNKE